MATITTLPAPNMRTAIQKIGNSRSIIIPANLLTACGLDDEAELTVQGKTLLIEAVPSPRKGWFEGYQPESASEDVWATLPPDEGDEEWQW